MPASNSTMQPATATSGLAIVSLLGALLGFALFPILGSVVAVVAGRLARREIDETQGKLNGEGLARAGEILGWIGIALSVVGVCTVGALVAVPLCAAVLLGTDAMFEGLRLPLLAIIS